MNQLFASGGQSIRALALASSLPGNIPLECRSLLQRRLSAYFTVWSCSFLDRSVRGSWILLVRIWRLLGPSQTVVPVSVSHSYWSTAVSSSSSSWRLGVPVSFPPQHSVWGDAACSRSLDVSLSADFGVEVCLGTLVSDRFKKRDFSLFSLV